MTGTASTPASVVVVLGTGTGVGKTWITAALARALTARGAFVVALKPIESGIHVSRAGASDGEILGLASSRRPAPAPFRFEPAVSPHLAARFSGAVIELGSVLAYINTSTQAGPPDRPCFTLVETAGGVFSPLSEAETNWDLARALDPASWVLVAPDSLGVLHDVTATLTAMRLRARSPDHVVLSAARPPDASTGTNATELARLGIVRPRAVAGLGAELDLAPLAVELLKAPSPLRE